MLTRFWTIQKCLRPVFKTRVYDHLNSGKPKSSDNKPKNIVIPEEHKKIEKDNEKK